jgi:hypothetical protein
MGAFTHTPCETAAAWLLLPLLHAALSHRVAAMHAQPTAADSPEAAVGRRFAAAPLDLTPSESHPRSDPPGAGARVRDTEREGPKRGADPDGLALPMPFICHCSCADANDTRTLFISSISVKSVLSCSVIDTVNLRKNISRAKRDA